MNWLSFIIPLELTKVTSPLNGEIKVVENLGKRTLYVNNAEQSGGTITGMWSKVIKNLKLNLPAGKAGIKNCLVLGLGGGTVIHILKQHYPEIAIDVIEFDPVIIDIAAKYFGITPSAKLNVIQDDAFARMKKSKNKFDLIVSDLYLGKLNPGSSRRVNFLENLEKRLNKSGIILFNAHYRSDEDKYREFLQACREVFPKVKLILAYPYSRILLLGN